MRFELGAQSIEVISLSCCGLVSNYVAVPRVVLAHLRQRLGGSPIIPLARKDLDILGVQARRDLCITSYERVTAVSDDITHGYGQH